MTTKMGPQPETLKKQGHPLADFTHGNVGTVDERNVRSGRFFVTAVAPTNHVSEVGPEGHGRNVHRQALAAVDAWTERRDAELVLLPMRAHVKALKDQPNHYDPILRDWRDHLKSEFVFNGNLRAVDTHLSPQLMNPLTGLWRIPGSILVAHPKQDLEILPQGNDGSPRLLHSTGSLTYPEYLDNRPGRLARENHVMGGLVVEIDEDVFHVRQVQFAEDGSFIDLGIRYLPDGSTEQVSAAAVKLGDIHCDQLDAEKWEAAKEIMEVVRPEVIVTGDVITHASISPHEEHRHLARAQTQADHGFGGSLEEEYKHVAGWIEECLGEFPEAKWMFDASNHHDWIHRYLDKGRYLKDSVNYRICHEMIHNILAGLWQHAPWIPYVDPDEECQWLTREDDIWIDGMNFACHGDMSYNGAKGSQTRLGKQHRAVMHGHTHTPAIRGGVWSVGHLSDDRHGYNKGGSSWLGALGVRYHGGHTQLVLINVGKWCR